MSNEPKDIVKDAILEHIKKSNEMAIHVVRNLKSIACSIIVTLDTEREIREYDKLHGKER